MEKETAVKLIYGLVLAGLIIGTVQDIRGRKVSLVVVIAEFPVLMGVRYLAGDGNVSVWIASLGIGAFFYLVSAVTGGQIGKGDAFVFCMTGAGVGLYGNIVLIYIAFFLAFLAAVFLLVFRRVDKKYAMPLTPFVLCAYCIVAGCQIMGLAK